MNKEYYQAKADLCRDLAVKQMVEEDSKAEARPYAPEKTINDLVREREESED